MQTLKLPQIKFQASEDDSSRFLKTVMFNNSLQLQNLKLGNVLQLALS